MKLILRPVLVCLSIPIFILFALSLNIRVQLLSDKFWVNSFAKGNVYYRISNLVISRLNSQVIAEGGNVRDVDTLSSLVSPNNLRGFVEDNIGSILLFINGKSNDLILTVPLTVDQFPVGSNPVSLEELSQKMTIGQFLKDFNINGIKESDIKIFSNFGNWSYIFTGVTIILFAAILEFEYLISTPGKRLVAPALSLIIPGLLVLSSYFTGGELGNYLSENYANSENIGTALTAIVIPPLIHGFAIIWLWTGIIAIVLGIILLLIKKRIRIVVGLPNK